MNIDRESAKWLKLASETYGHDGVVEMAQALGLPMVEKLRAPAERKRVGIPESGWTTIDRSGTPAWREPVRMPAMCPVRKPTSDARWKRYDGDPRWFHCGYEGFLENRRPSRSQPIAECFYDEMGRLVDDRHPYAGCRGTPDQYAADAWEHVWPDEGGVIKEGWNAFWESQRHEADQVRDFLRHAPREVEEVRPFRAPLPEWRRALPR